MSDPSLALLKRLARKDAHVRIDANLLELEEALELMKVVVLGSGSLTILNAGDCNSSELGALADAGRQKVAFCFGGSD